MSLRGRIFVYGLYAAGIALVGVGVRGVLDDTRNVPLAGWVKWLVGGVLIHDVFFAPFVLLAAALLVWLPLPGAYRRIVQAASVIGGSLVIVALPVVLGYGRRADNPSQLPLSYGRNLAVLLAVDAGLAVIACAFVAVRRHGWPSLPGDRRRRRNQTCRTDSLRKDPRR